jgi:ribonuclease HI
LETIEPFGLAPWGRSIEAQILQREEALKWAEDHRGLRIFVDASYRKGNAGIGIYYTAGRTEQYSKSIEIGHCEGLTPTHVEIMAIRKAVDLIWEIWNPGRFNGREEIVNRLTYVILSDSQTAIKAVARPSRGSGQTIARAAYDAATEMRNRRGPAIRLQWVPAHAMVIGDERADELAKAATAKQLPTLKGMALPVAVKRARKIAT